MTKVSLLDIRVRSRFLKLTGAVSTTLSLIVIFVDIPEQCRAPFGGLFVGLLFLTYLAIWIWAEKLNHITINV